MTIDNLNKSNLIPNKDYNKEKLLAGMLQLPQDFLLCVDETVLSAGELNQKGFNSTNYIIFKWKPQCGSYELFYELS